MNQELKNLQLKYAINLFDWYDFKSKKTGNEKDSKVLILGDVDDNLIFPISIRKDNLIIKPIKIIKNKKNIMFIQNRKKTIECIYDIELILFLL